MLPLSSRVYSMAHVQKLIICTQTRLKLLHAMKLSAPTPYKYPELAQVQPIFQAHILLLE